MPIDDPVDHAQAVTLQALCFAGIAWVATMLVVAGIRGSLETHPWLNLAAPLAAGLAFSGEVLMLRSGSYRFALHAGLAGLGITVVLLVAQGVELAPFRVAYLFVLIVTSGMLRGRGTVRLFCGVCLAALAVGVARDAGYLGGPAPHPAPALGIFGSLALPVVAVAVLLERFGGPLRGALEKAVRQASELRASEERFRVAFATTPDAMNLVRMSDGVYIEVNEAFTRMSGYSAAEIVGRTSMACDLWVDRDQRASLVERVSRGEAIHEVRAQFLRKDGSVVTGLISGREVTLGGVGHLFATIRDITERERLEREREALREQLLHAQKMEAIGRLAGGVAHDFNNVLTSVMGSAEALRELLPSGHPAHEEVRQIDADAHRAAELTRQLLSFARRQDVAPQVIRIEDRAQSLERMLRRVMGAHIAVETAFAAEGWPVFVDPGQVEQVIMNLAVNARDAMPDGGRLSITTDNVTVGQGISRPGEPPPGDYVLLSVVDTGMGMSPEVMAHAFEPFFTTKGSQGTGLGLATCFGIVAQAGGRIALESMPGRGTRFSVYLPRASATSAGGSPRSLDLHGSETVLVVEDESAVRRLAVRALRPLGYEVIDAGSVSEAQAKLSRHGGSVQCLLMDVELPDGEGREAAARILAGRDAVPTLYVSGSPDAIDSDRHVVEPSARFLSKPYTPIDLARGVRTVIDAARCDGARGAYDDPARRKQLIPG